MSRRYIPLLFVLISVGITCIITFVGDISILPRLIILFVVMVIFYLFGSMLEYFLNMFEKDIKEKEQKEREEQEQREREEQERAQAAETEKE